MPTPISRYTAIWDRLKTESICRITAPPPLHKRIIKAVIKRKWLDIVYKFQLSNERKRARLYYRSQGAIITFSLVVVKSIGVEDL